jgi:hypothetical protein
MDDGFFEALAAVDRGLRRTGAVIAHGVPRLTDDVDATVWADGLDLSHLMADLAAEEIQPRISDALEFARQNQVLLLRHQPSSTDMEVSLAWLPFEREALAAAQTLRLRLSPGEIAIEATSSVCSDCIGTKSGWNVSERFSRNSLRCWRTPTDWWISIGWCEVSSAHAAEATNFLDCVVGCAAARAHGWK